jgi:hypothetical protein
MSNHVDAAILDKIAGLLQLAEKNNNVNESAVAAQAAQTLLTKHRLTRADLDGHSTEKKESCETAAKPLFTGNRIANWRKQLAGTVAEVNGCRIYYSRQYDKTGTNGDWRNRREYHINIKIVGYPSDIDIVRYFFSYLDREIQRLFEIARAAKTISGKTGGTSFKVGACNAVCVRLHQAYGEQRAEAKKMLEAGTSQAIVKLDAADAEVDEFYNSIGLGKAKRAPRTNVDYDAYAKGQKAGKTVGLHKGLTGGKSSTKLLGTG